MTQRELEQRLAEEGQLYNATHTSESINFRKEFWDEHAVFMPYDQKLPSLIEKVIDRFEVPGVVVDLGCGNSRTVDALLKRGWKVIAVDNNKFALDSLQGRIKGVLLDKLGNLKIVQSSIEAFEFPENVQLILGMDSLPYTDPTKLVDIWDRAYASLERGGYIAGTFFTYHYCTCLTNLERKRKGSFYINISMIKRLLHRHNYRIETCEHAIPLYEHIFSFQPRKINFVGQKPARLREYR